MVNNNEQHTFRDRAILSISDLPELARWEKLCAVDSNRGEKANKTDTVLKVEVLFLFVKVIKIIWAGETEIW